MFRFLYIIISLSFLINGCKENSKMNIDIENILNEFQNRKKYDHFTIKILNLIDDKNIEQALIDYIFEVAMADKSVADFDTLKSLSLGFQYHYATWVLEAEVNNGGFNQYFQNIGIQFIEKAIEGFGKYKAIKTKIIVAKAFEIYRKEIDLHKSVKEKGTMEKFLESFNVPELNKFDNEHYNSGDYISKLRVKYIRENLKEYIRK